MEDNCFISSLKTLSFFDFFGYIQIIFQFAIFYHSERFILKGNDIIKLKAKITL